MDHYTSSFSITFFLSFLLFALRRARCLDLAPVFEVLFRLLSLVEYAGAVWLASWVLSIDMLFYLDRDLEWQMVSMWFGVGNGKIFLSLSYIYIVWNSCI